MISYVENQRLFHLKNEFLSCVLTLREEIPGRQELLMAYLGKPLQDPSQSLCRVDAMHEMASFDPIRQLLPYACPTEGRGDYRTPMAAVQDSIGERCTELYFKAWEILPGKPVLPGLPATYVESEEEAQTLKIILRDGVTGLEAELCYTIFRDFPAMTGSVCYRNAGEDSLILNRAGSLCLHLPGQWDLLHLHGAWAKERSVQRVPPAALTRSVSSARGASGHEHNPFVALCAPDATENHGECYGVSLVWSGDHELLAEENAFDTTRVLAGLNPRTFQWHLAPGEAFQAPEAVCVYSAAGFNGMSQGFHRLYRTRLCRGKWRDLDRPILINNWEATYFDFNHEKLLEIARTAAGVGVELFVLDDGWFRNRDSDNCSLGDWVPNPRKLPRGLKALAEDINALGMKFGLWFEPEMVSPDSDLYRAHPDWCLHGEGRPRTEARNQLILDLSRRDVQDYIIATVSKVLREVPIAYVKWDMNRNFKETGSDLLKNGLEGEISTRYMLGVYRVLGEVTGAFPEVLFESCSGGGGRFDPGILFYMPQTWTSDDSDAVQRLKIQYGTSFVYPPSAMGAHVSAVPNHQVGRVTSIKMRGDVALAGNFGYELDLSRQTPEDLEIIRQQVALVKEIRSVTRSGIFSRLNSPFEGNLTAWQFVGEDRLIVCCYRVLVGASTAREVVYPVNLPEGMYEDREGKRISASDLMAVGVLPEFAQGDFTSDVMIFKRV